MNMYFVEKNNKRVLIAYNKEIMPKRVEYPLKARSFISTPFQLCMIEAYIMDGWDVIMSQRVKTFWNSRPTSFDKRHESQT